MTTLMIGVASIEEVSSQVRAAFRGVVQPPRIDFVSDDLLWSVLTRERCELLKIVGGDRAWSIPEAASRLGRDEEEVRRDVRALLAAGVLDSGEDELIRFPYDAIHVDFTVTKAA